MPIYLNPPLCGGHCDTAITETKAKEEPQGPSEISHCDGEEDDENRLPAAAEEEEEHERDNDSAPVEHTMTEGDTAETMEVGRGNEEKLDSMAHEEDTSPTIPTTTQLQDIVETL